MSHDIDQLCSEIKTILNTEKDTIIVGIDGRAAAGKTTLSAMLSEKFDCNVFHMDDFFLRPEQRSRERLDCPGENVDHERFLKEVLAPASDGQDVIYQRYDCHTQCLDNPVTITKKRLNIVEGAYSFHPELYKYYDFKVFVNVNPDVQRDRIIKRNGADMAESFFNIWIPLEEKYIKSLNVIEKADVIFSFR